MTTYKDSGVDIDNADEAKRAMAKSLQTTDSRVLNTFGAFASLVQGTFPGIDDPVLVCKTEEPGSKQLLAFQHGKIESVCADMINHLTNDVIVMGATPLYVQDAVICGKLEKDKVTRIVQGIADACKAQGCVLTGGETSEQPGVIPAGTYILTASMIGVVDRSAIIDGSRIREGDIVLALASNGLHTNGYTLVRSLLRDNPALAQEKVGDSSFLDAALRPHRCYYQALRGIFSETSLHGLAHITGGGIPGNLHRILPKTVDASIDTSSIHILDIFKTIQRYVKNSDADMLSTFNLGVGITAVVDPSAQERIVAHLQSQGIEVSVIGSIVQGSGNVVVKENLQW
jgi:phosphoribosylformylglycinamidine cyclo-ligase